MNSLWLAELAQSLASLTRESSAGAILLKACEIYPLAKEKTLIIESRTSLENPGDRLGVSKTLE